jgi:hypothetical protein
MLCVAEALVHLRVHDLDPIRALLERNAEEFDTSTT